MTIAPPQRFLANFWLVSFVLGALGLLSWDMLSYYLIVIPAMMPLFFWVRAGAPGLPSLPILSGVAVIYYAIPILRWSVPSDDHEVIVTAAATIFSFLLSGALVFQVFLPVATRRMERSVHVDIDTRLELNLAFFGIASGLAYFAFSFVGWLGALGSFTGLVRAVAFTFAAIGCYIIGHARGSGTLKGFEWIVALGGLILLFGFAIAGLLLFGGILNLLAFVLGYVVAVRRIPWVLFIVIFFVMSTLQAGKYDIRDKYWSPTYVSTNSFWEAPGRVIDWFIRGTSVLLSNEERTDILERATLLQAVVLAQQESPKVVPFLEGETYALLPAMVIPRFVDTEKVVSQAGLHLLSVHYGLQTVEATETTTIAWGLIAEAWANFGFTAVPIVGALLGGLCGTITLLSSGVPLISLRMFAAIAAMTALLDVEADLSYVLVTMLQSVGAVFLIGGVVAVIRRLTPPPVSGRRPAPVGRTVG
jgi:hypothetical protein